MQFMAEVFYDPYFYDIELSIFSTDATRTRSSYGSAAVDWTLYKGSKQVFLELESGTYELRIVQKLQPVSDLDLVKYQSKCVQFQLSVIYAKYIDRQQVMPTSLNYYGLLGPSGLSFGETVYHC